MAYRTVWKTSDITKHGEFSPHPESMYFVCFPCGECRTKTVSMPSLFAVMRVVEDGDTVLEMLLSTLQLFAVQIDLLFILEVWKAQVHSESGITPRSKDNEHSPEIRGEIQTAIVYLKILSFSLKSYNKVRYHRVPQALTWTRNKTGQTVE